MMMILELPEKALGRGDHIRGAEPFGESIHCARCHGLMVMEQGFDSLFGASEAATSLRRCVQCGEVIDPVILQNRRVQLGSSVGRVQR
ncbi:MAG: hypothetical protein QM706_02705 [Nitrospira sp.]